MVGRDPTGHDIELGVIERQRFYIGNPELRVLQSGLGEQPAGLVDHGFNEIGDHDPSDVRSEHESGMPGTGSDVENTFRTHGFGRGRA